TGGILAPIVRIFGWIMEGIYIGLSSIGIYNVGLCIILFTLISKIIILPLTMKQQRSMKINQIAQPELNKNTKKYRNRNDHAPMMKQQQEMQMVYDKYGTSPTGGCATTLIQFPIIMSLYYVVRAVEVYIPQIAADMKGHPDIYELIPGSGIGINDIPGFRISPLLIVPILSFVFQFLRPT